MGNDFLKRLMAVFLGLMYVLLGIFTAFVLGMPGSKPVSKPIVVIIYTLFFYVLGGILIARGIYIFYRDVIRKKK